MESPHGFVKVWNDKTPEYTAQLKGLVDDLPWQELMDQFLPIAIAEADPRRGNFQLNFGYACGKSHAQRTEENISQNFGVAMPAELKHTRTEQVQKLLAGLTKILEAVGVVWTDKEFLNNNPKLAERLEMFSRKLVPGGAVETTTLLFQPPGAKLDIHFDPQNCNEVTQAVLLQRIMEDREGR